jgi:hypothetical protein
MGTTKEIKMTNPDDPNFNRRRAMDDMDANYTGWIVGGLLALVVIAGIFLMFGRSDTVPTASNTSPNRPAATAPGSTPAPTPGTTGSGSTSPPPPAR